MRKLYYQNTETGDVLDEDTYSSLHDKSKWVVYNKIPRFRLHTPPYAYGRPIFDENGPLCYWEDIKQVAPDMFEFILDFLAYASIETPKKLIEDAERIFHTYQERQAHRQRDENAPSATETQSRRSLE